MLTQMHQGYEHVWRKNGSTDKCAQTSKGETPNWESVASHAQGREIWGYCLLISGCPGPPLPFLSCLWEFPLTCCTKPCKLPPLFQAVRALLWFQGPLFPYATQHWVLIDLSQWFSKCDLELGGRRIFKALSDRKVKTLFMMLFSFFTLIISQEHGGVFWRLHAISCHHSG